MSRTITYNAKHMTCACGKKGEFLNTWCDEHPSNAFCLKCRDAMKAKLGIK